MANAWIEYVKSYAAKNGMSYRDALRCPKCKAGYKKGGRVCKVGKGDNSDFMLDDLEPLYDDYKKEFQITPSTKTTKYSKYAAKKKAKEKAEKAEKVKQVKFRQQTLDLPFDMKKEILGFLPSFTKNDKDRLEDLFQNYLDFNSQLLYSLEYLIDEHNIKISKKLKKELDTIGDRISGVRQKVIDILEKNGIDVNEDNLYYELSEVSDYDLRKVGLYYNKLDKNKLNEYIDSLYDSIDGWKSEITEIGNKQLPFKPIK